VAQELFFWLFVTMMRGRRDDEARLSWCFVGERCKHGVRGSTKSCEMVLLISPCPIKRWGWRMLMLNNKLCLTSVVEFLRRGRVDRGTGGGKGVVVVDSSKRKVWHQAKQRCSKTT